MDEQDDNFDYNKFLEDLDAMEISEEEITEAPETDEITEEKAVEDATSEKTLEVQEEVKQEEPSAHDKYMREQQELIDKLNKKLDTVVEYNQSVKKEQMEKQIQELESEKWNAFEYGDRKGWEDAEKKIKEIQEKDLTPAPEPANVESKNQEIPACVTEYADKNPWFEKDIEMTEFMVRETEHFARKGLTLESAIKKADESVRRMFSDKFKNPNKREGSPVLQSGRTSNKKGLSDLTEAQRQVWRDGLENFMTLDEYLKEIEAESKQ